MGKSFKSSTASISSKVIVVTGANAGIGKSTALELAKHSPKKLYLTARTREKYDAAVRDIKSATPNANIEFLELDLGSFSSVKRAADQFLAENDRLDILINNAGIMGHPAATTQDGYEIHFGTNHLGPALLTRLLLPVLEKTAAEPDSDVRIVNVSSLAHTLAPRQGILLDDLKSDNKSNHSFVLYGQSKLANILHVRALSEHFPAIRSVSVHPGRVSSSLLNDYFRKGGPTAFFQRSYDRLVGILTPEQGALNSLWAATGKKEDVKPGVNYIPIGVLDKSVRDTKDLATKLWDWQEAEFRSLGYV
ncbi:NAD(P)-binding protein [Tothia fuscella]|uniref:NAD(P)-binding protein n=1 Tax=Tothia fuscella TaxID=1048955 RepID=A0A9P4TSB4_9PEZI|nr:NAD(P)-binding protein [Tothia fuscella]